LGQRDDATIATSPHVQDWEKTMSESSHRSTPENGQPPPCFVGIDVSKDHLDFDAVPTAAPLRVTYDAQGLQQAIDHLKKLQPKLVVMEASGGYERRVAGELLAAGFAVVVANPRQVRDFAKGLGILAKTDAIDAKVLASFAQMVQPQPRPQPTASVSSLAELVARRRQLLVLKTQEHNRMGRNATRPVLKSIEQVMRILDKQLAQIDKLIAEQIRSDDGLKDKDQILQSTPGVSTQTSATLLANLPELGTLNRQQVASLVGVAPWDFKSGKFSGKSIIFGGRASVRQGLYMAAMVAMRHNPPLKAFAERLSAKGKAGKVVIVAVMRKLLTTLNSMIRNRQKWQSPPLKNA
jgi:transposase